MKRRTASRRFYELRNILKKGRLLDIGCANGIFVEISLRNGLDAEGIELSDVATNQACAKGLPLRRAVIGDPPNLPTYDFITGFDVLEHVLDPKDFVDQIYSRLKPGGMVALSTPNVSSFARHIMGSRWYFYIPEEHLLYFNPRAVVRLLSGAGLTNCRTSATRKPLSFDYSLTQFREYNPLLYRGLKMAARIVPRKLREAIVPLYIGEMMAIAWRPS